MAPVAGMLKERGFHVTGSDVNVYPPASTLLDVARHPMERRLPRRKSEPAPDLAVIGNAISRGNPEIERILDEKIPYCSMPQLLEDYFIPGHTSIVVAGHAWKNHHHGHARLDFSQSPAAGRTS